MFDLRRGELRLSAALLGEAKRDVGIVRSELSAERADPGWQDRAVSYFDRFPQEVFQAAELAKFAYDHGLNTPPEPRAWGAVLVRLKREGRVAFVSYQPCVDPAQHRCPTAVWRKVSNPNLESKTNEQTD